MYPKQRGCFSFFRCCLSFHIICCYISHLLKCCFISFSSSLFHSKVFLRGEIWSFPSFPNPGPPNVWIPILLGASLCSCGHFFTKHVGKYSMHSAHHEASIPYSSGHDFCLLTFLFPSLDIQIPVWCPKIMHQPPC